MTGLPLLCMCEADRLPGECRGCSRRQRHAVGLIAAHCRYVLSRSLSTYLSSLALPSGRRLVSVRYSIQPLFRPLGFGGVAAIQADCGWDEEGYTQVMDVL